MPSLRDESGFTVAELLTTITIALTIGLATFALVDFAMRRSGEVAQRVETTQRARGAMDTITRQLRSQVCMTPDVEPMLPGSTDTTASFYLDFTAGGVAPAVPELRTVTWDEDTNTITQFDWDGRYVGPDPEDIEYDAEPDRRKDLIDNVVPEQGTPVFTYYAFNTADPPRPVVKLPTPLSATDAARVARIEVAYRALPTGAREVTRASVPMHDEVYVRAADPNDPAPTPTCA